MALTLIASGDISDYTPIVKAAIAQNFAIAAGVPLESVHVDVESASVAISVMIVLPNTTVAAEEVLQVQSTFKRLLSTPRAATQFLSSVASGSIQVIRVEEVLQVLAPPSPPPGKSSDGSLPLVIGCLGGLAVVLAAICIYIRICGTRWKRQLGSLLDVKVESGLVEDGGLRQRTMRSVSFVTPKADVETKLALPRKQVLSDHI